MIKNAPRRSSYYVYTLLFVSLLLIASISIKSLSNNEYKSIVDTTNHDQSGIYESATVQDSTGEDENTVNDEINLVGQTNRANAVSPISNLVVTQQAGVAGPAPVNLGAAGIFVILSKAGISTTGTTSIVGNIGVSPIDSTAITGFGLIMDSSNTFSTSSLVTGKAYAADYTAPTPTTMTTAVSDMEIAYTDAAGRTNPTATELGAGNIDGMTITPGLYKWGTGVMIPNGVTLSGSSDSVWIFQIAEDLTIGNGAIITLSGGAQANNVFWQVAGQATLGTTSNVKGNILSATLIEMNTGATLNGRALAQTAVTLDSNSVTKSN